MAVKRSWDDPFERALLASAALDQPPPAALSHTLDALSTAVGQLSDGAALGASSAPSLAPPAAHTLATAAMKWTLLSLVIGALAGAGAVTLASEPRPKELSRTTLSASLYSENAGLRIARPSSIEPSAPIATVAAAHAEDEPRARPSAARRAPAPSASLAEEVRLIDAARSALREGSAERALATLRDYAKRFPNGVLEREASVLHVEALAASGDRAAARTQAGRYLKDHPDDPFAERVQRAGAAAGDHKE
jgi:TolA-binding protein